MNARRILLLLVVLAVVAGGAFFFRSSFQKSAATREFEFVFLARIPELPPEAKNVRVWIPLPPTNDQQEIRELTVESPVVFERHREPEYGNQYLYWEGPAAELPRPVEVILHFRILRREYRVALERGPGHVVAAARPEEMLERFLQPDRLVPTGGLIAQLAEQATRGRTEPLEKARAIYDYVVSTMRYDKSGEGWGRGDAIYACNAKQGNCTDFHALLIGMMRAAGIPARFEIGFPLPPDQSEGEIGGYHCWAQFYVEPYGWIPVDASEAWKQPEKREYFFGAHDQNRVLFTLGRDIQLNPAQEGEPLNYFIYPYVEVDGQPLPEVETRFHFRDLAASTAAPN